MADHGTDVPVRVDDIAEALSVPRNYLSKILHELGRAGVLVSYRGPRGGFRLARPAADLSLIDVVGRFDPLGDGQGCLLGRAGGCSEDDPCAAHSRWKEISGGMQTFFRETMVADLLEHPSAKDGQPGRRH